MIEAHGLTKNYGDKRAVDGLSFTVRPGIVTGFLGPNGSGKSTTMRLILGLDRPTAGDVTVNGKHYCDHAAPLHEVGGLLEARSVHTGCSAYNHLLASAHTHGIPRRRVDELIGRGRKIADTSTSEFLSAASGNVVRVRSPQGAELRALLVGPDVSVEPLEPGYLEVHGMTAAQIGDAAAANGLALHELTPKQVS